MRQVVKRAEQCKCGKPVVQYRDKCWSCLTLTAKCQFCNKPCNRKVTRCRKCYANQPRLNKDGYLIVGGKLQHRLIMEQHLGRPLSRNENVHHKNGVKTDNRIENLELWVTSQPSGQRPADLVRWAREILSRYEKMVEAVGVEPTSN